MRKTGLIFIAALASTSVSVAFAKGAGGGASGGISHVERGGPGASTPRGMRNETALSNGNIRR